MSEREVLYAIIVALLMAVSALTGAYYSSRSVGVALPAGGAPLLPAGRASSGSGSR